MRDVIASLRLCTCVTYVQSTMSSTIMKVHWMCFRQRNNHEKKKMFIFRISVPQLYSMLSAFSCVLFDMFRTSNCIKTTPWRSTRSIFILVCACTDSDRCTRESVLFLTSRVPLNPSTGHPHPHQWRLSHYHYNAWSTVGYTYRIFLV